MNLYQTPTGTAVFRGEDQGAGVQKGELARLSSFMGAIAIADLVKTTLGPKGMDKMLTSMDPGPQGGGVTVTNDGATILKKIPVDNPAAKILVNISMTQDDEVGDGTTTVVVLAGELLREAEKLTNQKIHPQTIIRGWRKAVKVAIAALEDVAVSHADDQKEFEEDLMNIARTTLSSKIVTGDVDFFARLCVDAVLRLGKKTQHLEMIQIVKKPGGEMKDSYLDDGFILDKKFGLGQKTRWENPKILIANTGMDSDKIKIWGARVRVHSMDEVAQIEAAEKEKMKNKVDKILKHDLDIFINRQLIYDYPEQLFTDAGKGSIEHADFEGVERLSKVLGADIVSTFDTPKETTLGTCALVEEMMIGEDTVLKFSGVPVGEACSIVLRGASIHVLDEVERSVHDALCILTQTVKESRVVLGGGACEMLMAQKVHEIARQTAGKEALAIEAFANALTQIPVILADNAGFDSAEIVTQLRAQHATGNHDMGVDMKAGTMGNVRDLKVMESFKSKSQSLISAHEAAEMILRVDDIVKSMPRQRTDTSH